MKKTKFNTQNLLNKFNNYRNKYGRYASYDYCYNYFQSGSTKIDLDIASLHLGMYLASWGMFRGSSFLLKQSSYKVFIPVIEILLKHKEIWNIDVDSYDEEKVKEIIELKNEIRKKWHEELIKENQFNGMKPQSISDTLISKVLMGTMGIVPAFDNKFTNGLKLYTGEAVGFNYKTLLMLKEIYNKNEQIFECKIPLISDKSRYYKIAKKIDMVFWKYGIDNDKYLKEERIKRRKK